MANLVTRKQLAALIGRSPQYVGSYIKRGKLIEEEGKSKMNKPIDTDHPINKAWIAKNTLRSSNELNGTNEQITTTQVKKTRAKKEQSQPIDTNDPDFDDDYEGPSLDRKKKFNEIKKLEADTQLKELELKKKKARVLPLDFVLEWSERNIKGVFGGNVNFAYSLIEDICDELGADIEVKLKYKKKFKDGLTEVVLKGIKSQEPEALEFAKEYSLQNKW